MPSSIRRSGAVVGLLAGLATVPGILDAYLTGLLMRMLIWGLFAASFDVIFGYLGLLSLGHSVYFALGAYGAAWVTLDAATSLGLALVAGVGLGTGAAAVVGTVAVRAGRHGVIILTAVSALIAQLLAQRASGITGGNDGLTLPAPAIAIGNWSAGCAEPGPAYLLVLGVVTLAVLGYAGLVYAPLGTAWQAIRENERQAEALGYPTTLLTWGAFTVAGTGAALAGGLYALTTCYVSTELFHWLVAADALIWTLLGGAGTLVGPLLGTGALVAIREVLSGVWPLGYPILVGIVLLVTVRVAPDGLVGRIRGLFRQR